ncbi:hypothetical protein [Xenorhabdus mauleonii]|nr:hypothetical protein [Xenorhabdus mauleonii]
MNKAIGVDVKSLIDNHLRALCIGDFLAIRISNFTYDAAVEKEK